MSAPSFDPEKLTELLRRELAMLWDDLSAARNLAINRDWSMQCGGLAERIKDITAAVGPTPWQEVPLDLLEQGIYQGLHRRFGVEVDVDMAEVARCRREIERQREAQRAPGGAW